VTTTTRCVSYADGTLVGPGDYDIVSTKISVAGVQRSNGLTIDRQDIVVEHTVAPRPVSPQVDPDDTIPADPVARCVHCAEYADKHGAASLSCLRAGFAGNRYTPMTDADEMQYLRAALHDINVAFQACFTPDFKGVDWDDDAAIQTLAARISPVLDRATRIPQNGPIS
jgi:hypothetical protein